MSEYSVISLFSGIGGIDIAFQLAGFKIIWANEIDHYACLTYLNNQTNNYLVEKNISKIDVTHIPNADIIIAGFPCQSFSIMGLQRGFNDPRGNLFFEIIRIAESIKPKIIFLENVKNLIYHDNGKTFITIYNSLAYLGYSVKYSLLNACTHGNIPQDRNRTFIVASSEIDILNRFSFPPEIPLNKSINDIIDRSVKHDPVYYYFNDSIYYDELNKKIKDKTSIYRIDDSGIAKKKYIICPTLKANMGTFHDRVPIIRDDYGIRKITPYECLALQGFPPYFKFNNIPLSAAYKQCGNTVCVPVVERIAKRIRQALD